MPIESVDVPQRPGGASRELPTPETHDTKPKKRDALAVPFPDFCDMVGCKRSLGFALVRRGEVVAVKLGRKTVITVASIHAMLERNAVRRAAKS